MTDQNNTYILESFELFNKAQEALSSLDSDYIHDYFRYLDYDHDYSEYYARQVYDTINNSYDFNHNELVKNSDILDNYETNKEKLIRNVQKQCVIIKENSLYGEIDYDTFEKQLIAIVLYDSLIYSIYENLTKLNNKFNPSNKQLKFSASAIHALTNETYFYESSKCW